MIYGATGNRLHEIVFSLVVDIGIYDVEAGLMRFAQRPQGGDRHDEHILSKPIRPLVLRNGLIRAFSGGHAGNQFAAAKLLDLLLVDDN